MSIVFNTTTRRWVAMVALGLPLILLVSLTTGCDRRRQAVDKLAKDSKQLNDFDNSLTFNSVKFEDFDKKGRLWWRVNAKQARYSKDQKIARITEPHGEFFQDGKSILKASAENGEVRKDGETIFLRGKIVATDTRDGLVLHGDELEWQPKADLVIVRNNVSGTHAQFNVTAKEAHLLTREKQLNLKGQVVADVNDPRLQFRSEQVTWQIQRQLLISDRPLQLDRYTKQTITDRATANQGIVDLKSKVAVLKQDAQIALADPPAQATSNSLIWNLPTKTIVSDLPLTIFNRSQGVTLTGNQGQLNLTYKMFYLNGNVRGVGERNQSQVSADHLIWNMTTQHFIAEGSVNYQQVNPLFNLTGPRASGTMKDGNILVSGGRVETQFIPDQISKVPGN
jgi:LPS export ABC transporter protein LptC